jgi:hypothetical protein
LTTVLSGDALDRVAGIGLEAWEYSEERMKALKATEGTGA